MKRYTYEKYFRYKTYHFQLELEEKYKELEKRCAALDLELIEARDRSDELEGELCAIRQLQVQRYR